MGVDCSLAKLETRRKGLAWCGTRQQGRLHLLPSSTWVSTAYLLCLSHTYPWWSGRSARQGWLRDMRRRPTAIITPPSSIVLPGKVIDRRAEEREKKRTSAAGSTDPHIFLMLYAQDGGASNKSSGRTPNLDDPRSPAPWLRATSATPPKVKVTPGIGTQYNTQ